jgi:8-oxo-dGTP diphosphatase
MMKLATLCYLRRAGKTLMVYRNKKPNDMHLGKWNGLGGKLERGESPEECAVREIFEESGLHVNKLILKGFLTFPSFSNDEDWYAFVYLVRDFNGSLTNSPEGELRWIENAKLLDLNLWEGDRIFLPLLDKPGIFSGKFTYKDGNLVEHQIASYPTEYKVF